MVRAAKGAKVTEITGTYDEAVRLAAEAAVGPSAELVQDAGWPGYEQVPGWIVEAAAMGRDRVLR